MFRITWGSILRGAITRSWLKYLQVHGASPYSRYCGCIGEPVCVHCQLCGRGLLQQSSSHSWQCTQTGSPMQPQYRLYGLAPWTCKYFSQDLVMAPWGWIFVWSETCRGERILCDFNVFFNKYVHELVTIDTDFTDAWYNYETLY